MLRKFSAIPEPTTDVRSLQNTVMALKEVVEQLTGQRPNTAPPLTWEELERRGMLTKQNIDGTHNHDDLYAPAIHNHDGLHGFRRHKEILSVNAANPLLLPLDSLGNTTLQNGYAYRVRANTNGTGTRTGSTFLFTYSGSAWECTIVQQSGTSSNHPNIEVGSNGASIRVSTWHANLYPVACFLEEWFVGNNNISPSFLA